MLEVAHLNDLKLVHISSGTVYGQVGEGGPITEDEPFGPTIPPREYDYVPAPTYCMTKRVSEQLVEVVRYRYGLKATALRLGLVYGRGDTNLTAGVTLLLRAALASRPFILPYGADTYLDVVDVLDVADAILLAATKDKIEGFAFNIQYEKGYWMREIAEAVEHAVPGSTVRLGPGLWPSKGVAVPRGAISWPTTRDFDISRARKELGYKPRFDISTGVAGYAAWMRRNWKFYSPEAAPLPTQTSI